MLRLNYSNIRFLARIGQCRDIANELADRRHPVQAHHLAFDGAGQLTMTTTDGRVTARSTLPVDGEEPAWQCTIDALGWNALPMNKADVFSLTHIPAGSRPDCLRVNANIDYQVAGKQAPVTRAIERRFRHQPAIMTNHYDRQLATFVDQPIVADDLRKALVFVLGHRNHSRLMVERASERERVCSWFADGKVMSAEKGVMRVARLSPPPFPVTINRHNATLLARWLAVVTPVCQTVLMAQGENQHGTLVTWFATSCNQHHFWITDASEAEFARHFVDGRLEGESDVNIVVDAKYLRVIAEMLSQFSRDVRAILLNKNHLQIECIDEETPGNHQLAKDVMLVTPQMQVKPDQELFRANGKLLAVMARTCELSGCITLRLTVRGRSRILVLQQANALNANDETYPLVMAPTRSSSAS